jgi:NarL family two-component system response regulator YdfI
LIRVMVVDDHPVVRDGLRSILETSSDLELVGEAADGREAIRLAVDLSPDVVLMDLRMPEVDGIEAITRLKEHAPQVEIVILTTYDDDELIVRGLRAGARGYLLKDVGRAGLFDAIRAAARGELLLPSAVADRLLGRLEQPRSNQEQTLTSRERQVLALMAQGAANKQIAARLEIAERTVKSHVTNVLMKLGAESRAGAVAVALRSGLLAQQVGE